MNCNLHNKIDSEYMSLFTNHTQIKKTKKSKNQEPWMKSFLKSFTANIAVEVTLIEAPSDVFYSVQTAMH